MTEVEKWVVTEVPSSLKDPCLCGGGGGHSPWESGDLNSFDDLAGNQQVGGVTLDR